MGVRGSVSATGEETPGWGPPLVALYRQRYVGFVRLAYLMTGNRDAAQDIVQDSFVAASRSWDRERDPEPYVRTIVVNGCRVWARRQRLERRHSPAPDQVDAAAADELWDALDSLKPRQRAAIVLRFYGDLADDEIGRLLDCRPATVRTAIHRALRQLRREIPR